MRIELPYKRFRFALDTNGRGFISRFPEATLRGGFGYTLRSLVCTTTGKPCRECLLRHNCAYAFLFETSAPPDAPRLRKYHAVPRPFMLRAGDSGREPRVDVTLIGKATGYLPYFIYTLNKLGRRGLGKQRTTYRVTAVRLEDGTVVYPLADDQVAADIAADRVRVEPGGAADGSLCLELLSPLVIRRDGRVLGDIDAYSFVSTLLRRVTNLAAFFGDPPDVDIDPAPYLDTARALRWETSLRPVQRSRFSTRQHRTLDYSGVVGTIRMEGDVGTLLPLLRAGEVVGVGKNTVFGSGAYRVDCREDDARVGGASGRAALGGG